jgi:Tfp pilus assembly protein PilF
VNEASTLSSIKGLIAAERYNEALVKIQELVKQYPDEILYYRLLASTYQSLGETDKSINVFKQLIDREPENVEVQVSLCDFLLTEKNYDELFLRLNGIVLNSEISLEDKISLYARIISEPELIKESSNRVILSIIVLEATYQEAEIVSLLRPEFLANRGDYAEAAGLLEEVIKKNSDNYYAWEKLLLLYLQMGDYPKLLIRGEECATKFNRSFLAKILYANGALELEKYAIAIEELRKAEILAGDNPDYLLQVLTMRADVYYRMKDFNKAFETFEQALKQNGNDLTLLNNYAYYLAEQNLKLKEAEEMAKIVISKEKDNTTFLDTYAWVLYKRGKLKEAEKVMSDIINSGQKPDAEWYEHYGYILKKLNKCSKAIEIWNIALKIDNTKTHLLIEIENCKKQ